MPAVDDMNADPGDAFVWSFGGAEFDEPAHELRIGGRPVALEPKPMALLAMLLRHAGEVVTKDEFFDAVWRDRITVDNVLATAIGKLRRVLEPVAGIAITTVARIGYRLDGPVRRMRPAAREAPEPVLVAGQAVAARPGFVLARCLADRPGNPVWLARNDRTGESRVYKFALDAGRLRSLRREATLARVLLEGLGERDDIVPILDWQFQEPPFFLEYPHGGLNLREWFEQYPGQAGLDQPRKLALFLEVVDAIAAAHGIGVLHKDIKPDNILVNDRPGRPASIRLIDFGSGVLLDPDALDRLGITHMGMTGTHEMVVGDRSGTLLYLAPEVLSGAMPTVRSDVYALGVLLYQWLIGDFRRSLLPGWEREISDELLREDIAAATDGVESARMGSASELADRIRRLPERHRELRDQRERVIQAQLSARSLERARARRPWLVAAVSLLIVGFGISSWQFLVARQAQLRAESQSQRAQATLAFLRDDILAVANPENAAFAGNPTVSDLVARAETGLDGRFPDQPAIRAEVRETLARTYAGLGQYEQAVSLYNEAITDYAAADSPDRPSMLRAMYDQVRSLSRLSRFDDADMLLARADELRVGLPHDEQLDLLAAVARGGLAVQRYDIETTMMQFRHADDLQRRWRPDDAALAYLIRSRLADGLLRTGDLAAAETMVETMRNDPLFAPERIGEVASVALRNQLARILRRQYRFDEALVEAKTVVADYERLLGPDHDQTIEALGHLSILYNENEDCEQTIAVAKAVVERKRRVLGAESHSTLQEIGNLGFRQNDCGESEAGLANVVHAERELRRLYGEDHAVAHYFRFYIGRALSEAGRHREALDILKSVSSERVQASSGVSGWHERFDAFHGMVMVWDDGERREEGLALLRSAREYILANDGDTDVLGAIDEFLAEHDPP